MTQEEELRQAIAFIKGGNKSGAVPILMGIIKADGNNERAWLWMSACVDKTEDKIYCLQEVLRINPNNESAKKAKSKLEELPEPTLQEIAPAITNPPVQQVVMPTPAIQGNTILCANCGMTIPASALSCPYCHKNPSKLSAVGNQLTQLGCAIWKLAILIPILIIIGICLYSLIFGGSTKIPLP